MSLGETLQQELKVYFIANIKWEHLGTGVNSTTWLKDPLSGFVLASTLSSLGQHSRRGCLHGNECSIKLTNVAIQLFLFMNPLFLHSENPNFFSSWDNDVTNPLCCVLLGVRNDYWAATVSAGAGGCQVAV